jgi:hypothetical protein
MPWELPGLARDLGLDPDNIVGYPAEFAWCRGTNHPWENIPPPVDRRVRNEIVRSSRCLSCTKQRHLVPDTGPSWRLFRWDYDRLEAEKHIPPGMTKEDHRLRWDELERLVSLAQKQSASRTAGAYVP